MAREPNIPLFLWVAAAILTHLTWGGGADEVAQLFEERADVRRFAASVDRQVRQRFATEISLLDDSSAEPDQARDDTDSPSGKPDDKATKPPPPDKDEKKKVREDPEKDKPPPAPEKELKKTPPKEPPKPQQKPEAQKEKKPKPEPEAEKKPVPLPQPQADNRRVAVVQHVDNPNQPDNPNAQYIADQANKVQQETQAHVTATDQDNAKPTPGSQYHGPTDNPGDSHVSDVAQSEDSPGEINKAPSEDKAAGAKSQISVSQPVGIPKVAARIQGGPAKPDPGEQGRAARLATSAQEAVQQTEQGSAGAWQIDKERDARLVRAAEEARRHRPAAPSGNPDRPLDFLGLGAPGQTELGVNLNLTPGTALGAIGQDQLQREIVADGERRRSKHQGSWKAVGIERWRPAIENYVASVKLDNQTALNTAQVPFATYLNHIHNRLHPIFAISYLGFLDGLPGSAGLHNKEMATNLEIVLSQANGSIVKMGVTRTSGVTAFDIAALDAVQRASPFGAPPPSIVSPDGNVYLHWEFHRDPLLACSTYFARPFILKVPQKTAPPTTEPPKGPFGPEEGSAPAKQGKNDASGPDVPGAMARPVLAARDSPRGNVPPEPAQPEPETGARLTAYAAP